MHLPSFVGGEGAILTKHTRMYCVGGKEVWMLPCPVWGGGTDLEGYSNNSFRLQPPLGQAMS